ncbi:carboxypeptidase C [Malassezia cuniculi]|uniref:Carboxypeptidase n=1 Tax=Malassezia cuniculi TaxID=948313 RepID=A0AAF0ESQ5_9BASI|nr:carboxypeptidase C [Malassezia cuniculi]
MHINAIFRGVAVAALATAGSAVALRNPFHDVLPMFVGDTAGNIVMHALKDVFQQGGRIGKIAQEHVSDAVHKITQSEDEWSVKGFSEVEGIQFQRLVHPRFPDYQLRINLASNASFCDPNVKQISGYLDIREDAHLWFVLYESRSDPKNDPLVLWLNGGPGCSSSTGMLFELGPCWVTEDGKSTANNEFSWNNEANLLFLDQPVQVGYSFTESEELVDNSDKSAQDVYAFLQLFFKRFPKYADLPFTVAAESYGGHYAPHIASEIHKHNKQADEGHVHINLDSIMIGNGLTDPAVQFPSVAEYACSPENKYHLFEPESDTCHSLQSRARVCGTLIDQCARFDSRLFCVTAALYCWGSLYGPASEMDVNLYDLRLPCNRSESADGSLCYRQMGWIEKLMNRPDIKAELGVPNSITFQSCNMVVNQQFMFQGDSMRDSAKLLPELLADGIRVLIYAGEADFMCNAMGNREWVLSLDNVFHEELISAAPSPIHAAPLGGVIPRRMGYVQKAGKGAGNLAFAWINEAGHMVPHDQPATALHMLNRWLRNKEIN